MAIIVRIIHGSIRRWAHRHEPPELGGLFGGHVGIEIDGHVYGFNWRDRRRIHIFPSEKAKNCQFQKQTLAEWATFYEGKKETFVSVPVTEAEKQWLLEFYESNLLEAGYDYSFFGQRCASSCFELLKKMGKIRGGHYVFNAFFPGMLRRRLLVEAAFLGWKVWVFQGSETRFWEGG